MKSEPSREEIEAFAAGELSPVDAERIAAAIAESETAAAELEECLQLRALLAGAENDAAAPRSEGEVISLAAIRAARTPPSDTRGARRRVLAIVAVGAILAAAAIVVLVVRRSDKRVDHTVAVDLRRELGPNRALVARLAWPEADGYRPYDVARAGTASVREPLSLELRARIERLGDRRARIAANLLAGDLEAARAAARDGDGADAESDRAAIALASGDAEQALVHAAAALALAPAHPQARWNRAAALERLELDASAAVRFAEIAAAGEPGWATEAAARAEVLQKRRQQREAASAEADRAGQAFVAGGEPPLALVATFPDRMRLYFYDALRSADTAERIRALRPFADALDRAFGETTLVALVDRVAAADLRRRVPLAHRYTEVVATRDAKAARALVDAAAGPAPDIAIGIMLYTGANPGVIAPDQLDRYRTLATQSGDPWFVLAEVEQRASLLLMRDNASAAESVLAEAHTRCASGKLVLRCQRIDRLLVHSYLALQRIAPARELLAGLLASARQASSTQLETNLLTYANQAARRRDDAGVTWQAIADAYLEEWAARVGTCAANRTVVEEHASALAKQGRFADARATLAAEAKCDAPLTLDGLLVRAYLATDATAPDLLAAVAARRQTPLPDHEQTFLDHIEGRLKLFTEPEAGRALLHRTIERAAGVEGVRARTYSYDALIEDAATRGAWADAFALFREEVRGGPQACVLAVRRDRNIVWIAVGSDGVVTGAVAPDAGAIVAPAALQAKLAGCASVEVIARGAFHGAPNLLPVDRAWHYRATGPRAQVSPAGAARTLVVADPRPPARLGLPALAAFAPAPTTPDQPIDVLDGSRATPGAVLAAMQNAGYIEIHAHGMLAAEGSDPSFLVLSPDEHGDYALTAQAVESARLARAPVVVLAACHAASAGPNQHRTWGLADAFVTAGARAVIASPGPIADAAAPRFFAAVRARIAGGASASVALRDERLLWTEPAQRAWIDSLVVFEATKEAPP
jgi:hypothetical protein